MCVVYWIRGKNHDNIYNQGYIGVTTHKNPCNRFKEHKKSTNKNLIEAFSSIEDLIFEIIIEEDVEYCYLLEQEFRPKSYIGWNITPGGRSKNIHYNTEYQKDIARQQELAKFANGSHFFLKEEVRKATSDRNKKLNIIERTCLYCNKIGKGPGMLRFHFDNCKYKNNPKIEKEKNWYFKQKQTCPHCELMGSGQTMKRWHFDNCRYKETGKPVEKEKIKKIARIYNEIKEEFIVDNVSEFCKNNDLPISLMHCVLRGERKHCRGYTGVYMNV